MSDDVYSAIKDNVDLLRARLNTLISNLANLAFSGSRTNQISNAEWTSWPENSGGSSGGDTPSGTPSLTVTDNGSVISNGATIDIGTATPSGVASKTIRIKGTNLNSDLSVSLSNDSTSGLGVSPSTITVAAATNGNGAELTLTYGNAGSSSLGQATGTLNITSADGINMSFSLTARYQSSVVPDPDPEEPTSATVDVITHLLNMTKTSGGNTATKGSPYTIEIATAHTYNDDLRVYMGGVNITSQCTITDITGGKRVVTPNVTGDIMVIATARTGTVTIKSSAQIDLKINGSTVNYVTSGSDFIYTWSGNAITSIAVGNTTNFINVTSIKEVDFGGVPLKAAQQLFQGCTGLTKVENIVVHIDSQAQANGLFANCTSLTSITGLNTWKVELATSMANMFNGVQLTSLDISGWVCNSITSVANMFSASALTDITIGYFNTGSISDTASNISMALAISGSVVTIHCKSKTPPTLNPDNNWLKNRSQYSPYHTTRTVYVKCPANCLAAYQAGAGWDSVGYYNGVVPQLSEES